MLKEGEREQYKDRVRQNIYKGVTEFKIKKKSLLFFSVYFGDYVVYNKKNNNTQKNA